MNNSHINWNYISWTFKILTLLHIFTDHMRKHFSFPFFFLIYGAFVTKRFEYFQKFRKKVSDGAKLDLQVVNSKSTTTANLERLWIWLKTSAISFYVLETQVYLRTWESNQFICKSINCNFDDSNSRKQNLMKDLITGRMFSIQFS